MPTLILCVSLVVGGCSDDGFSVTLPGLSPDSQSGSPPDDQSDTQAQQNSPADQEPDSAPSSGAVDSQAATAQESPTVGTAVSLAVEPEAELISDQGAAAITEVVLVTGQSNALGADSSYDATLDVPHPRAFAFTEDGWQVADLNQVWDLGWHPRNDPETDPSNNFGFHFARKVAQRRPERVIGFILVTAPGAGIKEWDYESEFYVKIRDKVITALNELPNKATIDGILWHQGETDWADSDYYTSKLNDLIRNFRGESWFGSNRPFICGETVVAPVNNRLMALNTDGDDWTGCVSSDGVPTFLDGLHFSADGLRIIGTRYATKYIQMTEKR